MKRLLLLALFGIGVWYFGFHKEIALDVSVGPPPAVQPFVRVRPAGRHRELGPRGRVGGRLPAPCRRERVEPGGG